MKRKESIFSYIQESKRPVTTQEIAAELAIQRSNASKDLNTLVREGRLIKTATRPVRYQLAEATTVEQTNPVDHQVVLPLENTFQKIIGSDGSMRTQIEQAKAAILYPPKGLNCLITGSTGTGKTLFAHMMFNFAKAHHLIDETQTLTVFNCADYANNSDLLMSHLFGYVKGAFTGADETTDGLIQQADGGMLFLDEVHRLPPEGQEMVFYFMDHGTYSRLGEVDKKNHANVRIVCATTEDPGSNLLSTFTRRIPIMIQLPNFQDRPVIEQFDLLKAMLRLEASRIDRRFLVTEDVVKALIGSVEYGNVGQLKSNVQLICARGFLNHMDDETIHLTSDSLTPQIKEGIVRLAANRKRYNEISRLLEPEILITPTDDINQVPLKQDTYELPYNLYEIIGDKAAILRDEGFDQEAINHFIATDINVHLKSYYQSHHIDQAENRLNELVDQDLIDLTKEMKTFLQKNYHYEASGDFIYAMSLHLSSFIKRIQSGDVMNEVSDNLVNLVGDYPNEWNIAQKVKDFLEEHYQIAVPKSEVYYLATLLVSLKSKSAESKVAVIVAAHGLSTASSMVSVVSQMLQVDNLSSFDMPLDMSPSQACEELSAKVSEVNQGKGVLLLVDMGSLSTFNQKIMLATDVEVRTIDMVTTAMVLEAARKTALLDTELSVVYDELKLFKGYSRSLEEAKLDIPAIESLNDENEKIILAICSTGEGTARKIKGILEELLIDHLLDDIQVKTVSVVNMDETIQQLQKNYHIVAAAGIKRPRLTVPYMTLEELLQGKGDQLIQSIDKQEKRISQTATQVEHSPSLTKKMLQEYIGQYYTFINPQKITPILWQYCQTLQEKGPVQLTNVHRLNLCMHLAGMIERILQKQPLTSPQSKQELQQSLWKDAVKKANQQLEETLEIHIPADEVYYIIHLCDTNQEK